MGLLCCFSSIMAAYLHVLDNEMELESLENNEEELVLEPAEWELDSGGQICVCGTPSTANLISCSGPSCPIGWFHKKCVALPLDERSEHRGNERTDERDGAPSTSQGEPAELLQPADWLCEFCDAGDAAADSVITSTSTRSSTSTNTNTGEGNF